MLLGVKPCAYIFNYWLLKIVTTKHRHNVCLFATLCSVLHMSMRPTHVY